MRNIGQVIQQMIGKIPEHVGESNSEFKRDLQHVLTSASYHPPEQAQEDWWALTNTVNHHCKQQYKDLESWQQNIIDIFRDKEGDRSKKANVEITEIECGGT